MTVFKPFVPFVKIFVLTFYLHSSCRFLSLWYTCLNDGTVSAWSSLSVSCCWRMTPQSAYVMQLTYDGTVSAWSSLSVSCSWRMTAYLCPMPDRWRHITCLMVYIFSWWMMTQILQVVMYVPIRCKIICQCSNVLLCRYFLYALY